MQSVSFRFSQEVKYGCTFCGECCRERWRIPLDAATRQSLTDRDWSNTPLAERARGDPEFFAAPAPTLATGAAFRTSEGACVFLGEAQLCHVHRHFGGPAKGVVCRLFPYLFVEAPEGVYVGYSFCCRPVRRPAELVQAEQVYEESTEAACEEARAFFPGIHYQQAPSRVPLGRGVEIPWDSYLQLEEGLLELLHRSGESIGTCLVAGHFYLNLCELFLQEYRDEDEGVLRVNIAHYVTRMRNEGYKRVDGMARRSCRRWGVRRYVLSVMLGLHEAGMQARVKRDAAGAPGMISRVRLMRAMLRRLFERYPRAELPEDLFSEAAGRYLRHVIWRKGLALGRGLYRLGGLCREYAMLLVAYALLEYFARRLTPTLGAEEAIAEALRIVERDFVLHAGRDEIGPAEEERDSYELFLGLFDSLVGSKAFAPSMVGKAKGGR